MHGRPEISLSRRGRAEDPGGAVNAALYLVRDMSLPGLHTLPPQPVDQLNDWKA